MENKIVYLKTYIITIVVLLTLFIAGLLGIVFYYENRIENLENMSNSNQTGITIVENLDTNVDNVKAK